jgi:hypothetical protein
MPLRVRRDKWSCLGQSHRGSPQDGGPDALSCSLLMHLPFWLFSPLSHFPTFSLCSPDHLIQIRKLAGVVADTYNPSIQRLRLGGLRIWGQPGLHCEILSQKISNTHTHTHTKKYQTNDMMSWKYKLTMHSKDLTFPPPRLSYLP